MFMILKERKKTMNIIITITNMESTALMIMMRTLKRMKKNEVFITQ